MVSVAAAAVVLASCGSLFASAPTEGLFRLNNAFESSNFPILTYLRNARDYTNGLFTIPRYNQENAYVFEYLASRVISLKFQASTVEEEGTRINAVIGTGIILAKANKKADDYNYYVATNLHVAANLLNNENYELGFHVNSLLNTRPYPAPADLLSSNAVKFNLVGTYMKFKNFSKNSLV